MLPRPTCLATLAILSITGGADAAFTWSGASMGFAIHAEDPVAAPSSSPGINEIAWTSETDLSQPESIMDSVDSECDSICRWQTFATTSLGIPTRKSGSNNELIELMTHDSTQSPMIVLPIGFRESTLVSISDWPHSALSESHRE